MLGSLLDKIRFLIDLRCIREIYRGAVDAGLTFKALKAVDKEFSGDKSWEDGKAEFVGTLVLIVAIFIIISWII